MLVSETARQTVIGLRAVAAKVIINKVANLKLFLLSGKPTNTSNTFSYRNQDCWSQGGILK